MTHRQNCERLQSLGVKSLCRKCRSRRVWFMGIARLFNRYANESPYRPLLKCADCNHLWMGSKRLAVKAMEATA